MAQTGRAHWEGDLKSGKGTIALGSGAFEGPVLVQDQVRRRTWDDP